MFSPSFALLAALFRACFADPAIVPLNPATSPAVVPLQQLPPSPYEFGYEFGNGLGMYQHRREISDGTGIVKGSYGYLDPIGVRRTVEYIAGKDGYRATIFSNEPGLSGQNSAGVNFIVQPPPPAVVAQGLRAATSGVYI